MQSSHSSAGYSHSGFALVPRAPIRQTKTPSSNSLNKTRSSNSPNQNTVIQFVNKKAVILSEVWRVLCAKRSRRTCGFALRLLKEIPTQKNRSTCAQKKEGAPRGAP